MAYRSIWENAGRASVSAGIVTAHALVWEMLRAYRGDYWSGWCGIEVWGLAGGAIAYFATFWVLAYGIGMALPGFGTHGKTRWQWPVATLVAGVAIWAIYFWTWTGARFSAAVLIAGTLLPLVAPLGFGVSWAGAIALGLTPSLAGLTCLFLVGRLTELDPSERRWVAPMALVYMGVAWCTVVALWLYCRKRSHRMSYLIGTCAAIVAAPCAGLVNLAPDVEQPADHRSLVLITVDALRADYCGVYGGHVPTPILDRLGHDGVVFDRAYALGPWTLPSMTGLFASMYPPSLTPGAGRERWIDEMRYYTVPADVPLLAELLQKEGYATYAIVANKLLDQPDGMLRGFDDYAVFHSSVPARSGALGQLPFMQEWVGRLWPTLAPPGAADTTRPLRDLAAAFIRRHRHEPFFLWIHFMDPHTPWDPPERFRSMTGPWRVVDPSDVEWGGPQFVENTHMLPLPIDEQNYVRSLYDSEIRYVDESIGRVLDTLDRAVGRDSTFVCVTADHGEEFWDHGQVTHGQSLFEELVRVPLLMSGPGLATARVGTPVSHLDLMPTLAEALGIPAPAAWHGTSMLDRLTDNQPSLDPRDVFAQGTYVVAPEPLRMIVRDDRKVVERLETHQAELYDLQGGERHIQDDATVQAGVVAMDRWWETFPATTDRFRIIAPDTGAETLERLRSLGYLD